jgi:hypothetical protein
MAYNETFIQPFINGDDLDLLGFVVAPFAAILGDYFYLLFGLIPVFLMYLKAQDIVLPLICGLLFTAAFGVAFPATGGIAILMLLGTGVGAVLFQIFKGGGN